MGFKQLDGYTPQKVDDGFSIIKGNYTCQPSYARIEESTREETKGQKLFVYELTIVGSQDNLGRKLWKRVNLQDESEAGQKKMKALADAFFTLDLEFSDEETLLQAAEKFCGMLIKVRCWGWTPPDATEPIQLHTIKGRDESLEKEATVDF